MTHFHWSPEKNELLKQTRGLSFDEIVYLIKMGKLLAIEDHPTRQGQKLYIVQVEKYAVVVPFVETEAGVFLKTAFASRKRTKQGGDTA